MLKYIPLFKRIFLYVIIGIVVLVATVGTLSYLYQDKIVNLFIEEANKKINTPVQVEKISFSVWTKFPNLTVSLENVLVQEGVEGSTAPLGKASHVYFVFSLFEFFKGNYVVDQVHLEQAEVFLKVFPNGKNNYTIFEKDTTGDKRKAVAFQLEKVNLDKVLLNYKDLKRDQEYTLFAKRAKAKLFTEDNIFDIDVVGEMESRTIRIREEQFFKHKDLRVNASLNYHLYKDSLNINPSSIFVHDSEFLVQGVYHGADKNYIKLSTQGENTDIQTILSLMSEKVYDRFKVYRSDGNVYFKSVLEGTISETSSPWLQISFGCREASFFHPEINRKITGVNLEGLFEAEKTNDLSTAKLSLNNIKGTLEKRSFSGDLFLENFEDPFLKMNVDAEIDAGSLLEFYPVEAIKGASGIVDMDISFAGKLNNLKTKSTSRRTRTSGEIILKELDFALASTELPFHNFNGSFIFKNEDLAISDFSGKVGNSDFMLNGFFKNIISYLIFEDKPISIEADLSSHLIDMDELLTGNISEAPEGTVEGEQHYSFEVSPKLALSFNCDLDKVKFRRFLGHDIQGKLVVSDQVVKGTNIYMDAAGGNMRLNGTVDATKENFIEVTTESSFDGIHIDSIFYIFQNFNQDFLVDRHLKGQLYAEVNTYMVFDNKLRFRSPLFSSQIGIAIRNGELNNFEPMQKLSKFVEEESLSKLRFSELKNIINIADETIYLPPMDIKSNVSTIQVKGTHTFDQHIDYNIRVPLRDFRKRDTDSEFGAIEEGGSGTANLFLTIRGTTNDYKIGYDSKAVKEKIKADIKKEGKELKEIFQNKGKQEKEEVELNEGEYFDF